MKKRGPPFIEYYIISKSVFDKTIRILRKRGKKREEGLVLWVGLVKEDWTKAHVVNCITLKNGHWGGGVDLDYKTLVKISDILNERGLLLLAQIHTHPGDFGHSYGDEKTPSCHRYGFISIVVPDYASNQLRDLAKCYVYEYQGNLKWRLLDKKEILERFSIENSVISV